MSFIYVAEFSSGHIKVGRSHTPEARIAAHQLNVSCLGVELTRKAIYECAGNPVTAETALIAWCARNASKRFQSEWFLGLTMESVCDQAQSLSQEKSAARSAHTDSQIIDAIGGPLVAAKCNVTRAAVSQWRKDGIPEARRMYLEVLFPEAFEELPEVPQ